MTARPLESRLIVVTDRRQAADAGHRLVDVVAAAVDGGARTVLLREKDLSRDERARLARRTLEVLAPAAGLLLVAGDVELARSVGAAGVHLPGAAATYPAASAGALSGRRGAAPGRSASSPAGAADAAIVAARGPGHLLAGRSCHSTEDLRAAEAAGLAYATLSPIWPTDSKPGYGPALGPDGLATACIAVPRLPVYALGGVGPGRVAACIGAGAAGVAVMGAVMRAEDPAKVVRVLVEEMEELS